MDAIRAYLQAARTMRGGSQAMESLVAETSRWPLLHLDTLERMIRTELWSHGADPSASMWDRVIVRERPLNWLDLCSADGYVRERAMRCLTAGAPNALFFALALRRLNDWVPQVRKAAREHLPLIAAGSNPDDIADALWSILPHAASWGRMDDRAVLEALISMEPVANALRTRISNSVAGPASHVLAQVGRASVVDEWLEEIASQAAQPSVRARAYRCLFEGRMVWLVGRRWVWTDLKWCKRKREPVLEERPVSVGTPFPVILRRGLQDSSPMVRRVAAEFLIRHLDAMSDEAGPLAQTLASDSSTYVAALGRYALQRLVTIKTG